MKEREAEIETGERSERAMELGNCYCLGRFWMKKLTSPSKARGGRKTSKWIFVTLRRDDSL